MNNTHHITSCLPGLWCPDLHCTPRKPLFPDSRISRSSRRPSWSTSMACHCSSLDGAAQKCSENFAGSWLNSDNSNKLRMGHEFLTWFIPPSAIWELLIWILLAPFCIQGCEDQPLCLHPECQLCHCPCCTCEPVAIRNDAQALLCHGHGSSWTASKSAGQLTKLSS